MANVNALKATRLLDSTGHGIRTDYDTIETRITV